MSVPAGRWSWRAISKSAESAECPNSPLAGNFLNFASKTATLFRGKASLSNCLTRPNGCFPQGNSAAEKTRPAAEWQRNLRHRLTSLLKYSFLLEYLEYST